MKELIKTHPNFVIESITSEELWNTIYETMFILYCMRLERDGFLPFNLY